MKTHVLLIDSSFHYIFVVYTILVQAIGLCCAHCM
uniref:Uncharacterized protein n=1 Tax=Anguilla anguilla TaxID=7936 RepID=A0A0E9QI04_ANGAN